MPAEARAVHKYRWMSARKVRRVVDQIRGQQVESALNALHFSPYSAARPVEKAVRSTVANLMNREDAERVEPESIRISEVYVDEGKTFKKFRPRAMGRATWIRKRTSHITVVVQA